MTELVNQESAALARAQIERIKTHLQAGWYEIKDFYDHKRWVDLGYTSFSDCTEAELGFSKQHAFRLLDAAIVRESLSSNHLVTDTRMNEYQARVLRPLPPEDRREIAQNVDFATTSARSLQAVVKRYQEAKRHPVAPDIPRLAPALIETAPTTYQKPATNAAFKLFERLDFLRQDLDQPGRLDAVLAELDDGSTMVIPVGLWVPEIDQAMESLKRWRTGLVNITRLRRVK